MTRLNGQESDCIHIVKCATGQVFVLNRIGFGGCLNPVQCSAVHMSSVNSRKSETGSDSYILCISCGWIC